jgi:hypothetical protein
MSGLGFPNHVRLDARKINRLSGGLSIEITGISALHSSRDSSFRWHDGENWEVISTHHPSL